MDLREALQRAIAQVTGRPVDEVLPETRLKDLGVDSLAVAEIIVELEMELDRQLPVHLLRRLDGIQTVGDVADELARAVADEAAAPAEDPLANPAPEPL